jgi:F-type H+-transporting ATPase subunit alpha
VQNGYVDDVPVERIKEFQTGWADFLTTQQPAIVARIGAEKTIGPELTSALKAAADRFKQMWKK